MIKVQLAERYGAKGVLIYSDPFNSATTNHKNYIYPDGEFLPKDGTQRGTLACTDLILKLLII